MEGDNKEMINVTEEYATLFTICSMGVITGLFMCASQYIISAIVRVFVVIANN